MNILISVTHLLGAGHLSRAALLAKGFAARGHQVWVISGGFPAPHIDLSDATLVQLPPVRSDGTNFTALLGPDGPADDAYFAARLTKINDTAQQVRADVVITELFPFGRRVLSAEFLSLLEAARVANPAVKVFASIRDILSPPSSEKKAQRCADIIEQHYDAVLVHSDPSVVALDESWPVTPDLAAKLRYTGFVDRQSETQASDTTRKGIVVSAGGGAVGAPIFAAACKAALQIPDERWQLLIGGSDATDRIAVLNANAPENLRATPLQPDFRALLARSAVSVSMCGYNTALDLLATGVPAVLIPFDDDGETEQTLRAGKLSTLPGITQLRRADLTAETLVNAIQQVQVAPKRPANNAATDGAAESVRIVEAMT